MRQIIQDIRTGKTLLEEVPSPQVKGGYVLIRTTRSLVSLGTERMLVEFGKANLIDKARQQPDKVKQVLDKIKTEGLVPTLEAVFNKLGQPLPLGYCNVGKVIAIGNGVTNFKIGDRVASNGEHAEFVSVPKNLVAHIPDNVSDDEASFTVIGSIGLEGIRLLKPQLGETITVIGLGLIGLIVVQLLKGHGCDVIGVDFDQQKVDLACSMGIKAINPSAGTNPVEYVEQLTNGIGVDGVIITASTQSNDVIHEACLMSRKRGRIVLVGVIGLDMRRDDFYKKELSFQVSCSYGPGRYDEDYENRGIDYPFPFVRWTENRNFQTILFSISSGILNVKKLITEEVKLSDYEEIYGDLRKRGSIASIIKYPEESVCVSEVTIDENKSAASSGVIGIIGAGNYTSATIVPALLKAKAHVKYVSAKTNGLSAKTVAKKMGAAIATTNYKQILNDSDVKLVICSTRHDAHAKMILEALDAGKNIFVEKPLCLNTGELNEIIDAYKKSNGLTINVGFNRRFAPIAVKMKKLLGKGEKNIIATMNAGFIPSDVWVHDLQVGGGRIIGEACHFIDLCSFITDSAVTSVCVNALGNNPQENSDNMSILLKYADGSNAVINYFANGSKSYEKERVEVFAQERVLVMDNWRCLKGYGFKGFSSFKGKMDKGHQAEFALLNDRAIHGGAPIIPFESVVNTTKASLACIESLKKRSWIDVQ